MIERREFIKRAAMGFGAISLSGSLTMLTGCGGGGGNGGAATGLVPTRTPGGVSPQAAAAAVGAASGMTISNVVTTDSGFTVTTGATDPTSVAAELFKVAGSLPSGSTLGLPISTNGITTMTPAANLKTTSGVPVTITTLQGAVQTYLTQLQALPADQAVQIAPGQRYVLNTYTVNGQTFSSPAILDANGNLVFDLVLSLIPPATTDKTHFIKQNPTQQTTLFQGSLAVYSPADGHLFFSAFTTGYVNMAANGNFSSTNPVSVTPSQPVLGPGMVITTGPTQSFTIGKGVAAQAAQTRAQTGVLDVSWGVEMALMPGILPTSSVQTEAVAAPGRGRELVEVVIVFIELFVIEETANAPAPSTGASGNGH